MHIRQATENDFERLVELDRKSYGDYGSNKEYFARKFKQFPEGMVVVEKNGQLTGLVFFEIIEKSKLPDEFEDMVLDTPVKGKWMHPVIFTTDTNYKDKKSDSRLLEFAEIKARELSCKEVCVPLTKNHPYKENGVFDFWILNGYSKAGEIKWVPNKNDIFECFVYRKVL